MSKRNFNKKFCQCRLNILEDIKYNFYSINKRINLLLILFKTSHIALVFKMFILKCISMKKHITNMYSVKNKVRKHWNYFSMYKATVVELLSAFSKTTMCYHMGVILWWHNMEVINSFSKNMKNSEIRLFANA